MNTNILDKIWDGIVVGCVLVLFLFAVIIKLRFDFTPFVIYLICFVVVTTQIIGVKLSRSKIIESLK